MAKTSLSEAAPGSGAVRGEEASMTGGRRWATQQQWIDDALDRLLPSEELSPALIHRAMRYSVMAGGKRIRPLLCLEAARTLREETPGIAYPACALEMVHTYSLIHDDLPALDNDDLRRGRPTCHKVFGEAMAILAGDALLTLAFELLSETPGASATQRAALVRELAVAGGTRGGMIGGQVLDLEGEGKAPTAALLEGIHRAKTGALLRASIRMGAILAGAADAELDALSRFGEHLGLAFQIVDDILDVEQSSEALGKTAGKDVSQQKITFPAVFGLEASREMAATERRLGREALSGFGSRADGLHALADLIVDRTA
ncbi:MAG: polyprenyl synthetase family protein [Bryobacterales bacterium]|nr:polyprenyl synthetase family protein [Bryobacterales bacterium]